MSNAEPIERRSYPSPHALQAQIALLVKERDEAHTRTGYLASKLAAAERTAEVLRTQNGRLRVKLDRALERVTIYQDSTDQVSRQLEASQRRLLKVREIVADIISPEVAGE